MNLFKRIIIGLAALLVIIAVIGAVVINSLDLNKHKDRIQQLVLEKTGRQLQINGSIDAVWYPRIGLSINDVALANAVDFTAVEFATVQSSELQVEIWPLLTGNVEVKTVALNGLTLKLQRDADGKTNWDDLMSNTAVVETESGDDIVQEVEAGTPVVAALSIGDLRISAANIQFIDDRANTQMALSDFNLTTGNIVLSEPFDFDADFTVTSNAADGIASAVDATGAISFNLVDNIYQLKDLQLSTLNSGASLPVEQLPMSLNGDVTADLNSQTIDIDIVQGDVLGVPVNGEFHATDIQDAMRLTGQLSSGDFNAGSVVDQLGLTLPEGFDKNLLDNANVAARFEKANDRLTIDDMQASVGDMQVYGDIQVDNLSSSGVVSGQVNSSSFNPAPWLRSMGVPVSDAMQSMQVVTSLRQSGQRLSFNQLTVQLDETQITGDVEVTDIQALNRAINFALQIDTINLDRYLPEVPANSSDEQGDQSAGGSIPVEAIRQLNLEGQLSIAQLTVAGLSSQNVVLPVSAKDGRVEIKEAKAELYKGAFFSTVSLDVQSEEPLLTVAGNLNGLDADSFLQDYLKEESPLTGIANINIDLLSRGNATDQFLQRAQGAISTRFTEGTVRGVDIASELRRASRVLSGLGLLNDASNNTTDFTELSATAVVADGVLQSDDLQFNSPFLSLSGQGGVNLVSQTVDFLLQVLVTKSPQVQQDKELNELAGIELSVPVRGQFNHLSVDFKTLLLNAFKSDLIGQLRDRKAQWVSEQQAEVSSRIEKEKAALQERLEKEKQEAAVLMQEKRKQAESKAEELKQDLNSKIESEKKELKNKLEDNLKKGLNDLLSVE